MASGTIKSETNEFFAHSSRNSTLSSGTLFGVYNKNTKVATINFYASAASSFGVNMLFTVPDEYRPKAQTEGSGMIKQSNGSILLGNVRIKTDGTVMNAATTDCVGCFGIITYSL